MKKGKLLILSLSAALLLSACGGTKAAESKSEKQTTEAESKEASGKDKDKKESSGNEKKESSSSKDEKGDSKDSGKNEKIRGKLDGKSYVNENLGIRYTLPDGWSFATEEQLQQMNGAISDTVDDETLSKSLENGSVFVELYAANAELSDSINITIQNAGIAFGVAGNAEAAIDASIVVEQKLFEQQGFTDVSVKKGEGSFAGKSMSCIDAVLGKDGLTLYEKQFILKQGNYAVTITASSANENRTEELMKAFTEN